MSNLRRFFKPGYTCFLTNVTHERRPVLVEHIDLYHAALETARTRSPFETVAWCVLPDHFHIIAASHADNLPEVMRRLKLSFSTQLRGRLGMKSGRIWQYRFWDHIIRDQEDLNRHIDYVHYNPVKHGYTQSPFAWSHSSIHSFLQDGCYEQDWGMREDVMSDGEFGE
jgi:putative transposase